MNQEQDDKDARVKLEVNILQNNSILNPASQEKNREIEKYLDEITALSETNNRLETEVETLNEELRQRTDEAEM